MITKASAERVVKVMASLPISTPEARADPLRTVCCIYHAPKPIDESSDESSSDDSSSDNDSGDDGSARPAGGRRRGRGHSHDRGEGHDCGHGHGGVKGKRKANRARSPNAYEKMPKVKDGVSARGS